MDRREQTDGRLVSLRELVTIGLCDSKKESESAQSGLGGVYGTTIKYIATSLTKFYLTFSRKDIFTCWDLYSCQTK